MMLTDRIPRDRFLPLPRTRTDSGSPRRTGIEIEFAALTETEVATIITRRFGGVVMPVSRYELRVEESSLGALQIYLDTALRKGRASAFAQFGLELGREVIPVEIVTDPLEEHRLPELDLLREELRLAGALGSGGGLLLGFGVHFNVEIIAPRVDSMRPVLTAFALIEDWLRLSHPMDGSRRLLPFVDPYPRRFVRRLLDLDPAAPLGDLIDLYLETTPTRNRSLDMLPLFRHLDEARLVRSIPNERQVSARPAYHYRLPDCRVDEPDWTLAFEWNRWVLVERLAGDGPLLARLAEGWLAHDREGGGTRHEWCGRVEALLARSEILGEPA